VSGEIPGARRRALDAEPARLADDLDALPEPPAPEPPRRRGLGWLIGLALLAGAGLLALDLWAFVEARFAASAVQGWIAATLVAALALVLVLLALREMRGLRRLARVEAVRGDPDRAAEVMERDPRLARRIGGPSCSRSTCWRRSMPRRTRQSGAPACAWRAACSCCPPPCSTRSGSRCRASA
jgi:uncharacterized membrane protein YcjF (UPF0283 family)